jgi:dTDP-4-amino-4,6-dideoxygalactose transaminase
MGQRVGTFGELSCFSFHPSKNLAAAGDGGAVATSNNNWNEELRCRRELGQKGQNHHVRVGLNSKLDAIQARILRAKLNKLDEWNAQRRVAASRYDERLSGLPISFQSTSDDEEHVYHLFQIRTRYRDELADYLKVRGVDVTVRYPTPIHLQPAFADCGWKLGQFPVSEVLARELLCLPIRPDLSTEEVDYVSENVAAFFSNARSD